MSDRPKPTIQVVVKGKRLWDFAQRHRLRCPLGHKIPNTFDIYRGVAFTRCNKWVVPNPNFPDVGFECGKWLWVYAVDGGGAIVCEVKLDEKDTIGAMGSTTEMLNYLGILERDAEDAA